MAFYKLDGQDFLVANNFVLNANYELRVENYQENTYPVDGWYWFDSEVEAKLFFGVQDAEN